MPPNKPKWLGMGVAIVALLVGITYAHGQKQTERYIPLGQSPGLSGKVTDIGEIEATDPAARTITVAGGGERRTFRVTDRTRIWVDRSQIKLATLDGNFANLQRGQRVEVMLENGKPGAPAAWIKVEITGGAGPGR